MRTDRTDQEIAFLKSELCSQVADGAFTTKACRDLGIKHTELGKWRKEDQVFRESLEAAQEHLTEVKADELVVIHEKIPNPKVAAVASNNLRKWLAWRNPKTFGEKAEAPNDQPELLAILRAAIARSLETAMRPDAPQRMIELKPDRE